jgi:hypothetical protein
MADHDYAVAGDGHVHLEKVDALLERVFERRQRVFGTHRAGAAMPVDLDASLGRDRGGQGGGGGQKQVEESSSHGPHLLTARIFFRESGVGM